MSLNPFKKFTKFDYILWFSSLSTLLLTFILSRNNNILVIIATLIGVTGLVFWAKGHFVGHICSIVFAIFYGISSLTCFYYGEFITYVFMTLPMAVVNLISWIKNPYEDSNEVRVSKISHKKIIFVLLLSVVVTFVFYFILKAFNTNNLIISTISIGTSFVAISFSALRSPLYAVSYAINDVVLIILWIHMSKYDKSFVPFIISFSIFLVQDIYAFISWEKMKNRQNKN